MPTTMNSTDNPVASGVGTSAPSDPQDGRRPRRVGHLPGWTVAVVTLTGVVVLTVIANLWWIAVHRPGLPFDVDESGYLQRAIRDSDALHAGGLSQLLHVVRQPDPQAPLVPVTAGFVRYVTGAGPYRLLGVEQLFVIVLAVATYVAASRLASRRWAVLAAVVVLALPGVIDGGRQFGFALPAAAMVTAALAAQLGAADFRSTPRSLVWGLLLGLAALSRTMVLGFIAALLVAAAVRLVAVRAGPRQLLNAGGAVIVGFVVAALWYSATWRAVAHYLTSYGYGANAARFGLANPVLSMRWWTERFTRAANTDVFFPLAAALAVCTGLGVVGLARRRRTSRLAGADHRARRDARRARLAGDPLTVALFVVLSYLVLSSTRNAGSDFELALIPAAVLLIMAAASRAGGVAWPVALTVCTAAAVFSFAAESGVVPGSTSTTRSISLGSLSMPVFDSRGSLFRHAELVFGGCPSIVVCMHVPPPTTDSQYLVRWLAAVDTGAGLIHADALARDRDPVVFFSVQDPFFDTNSVDLAYQLAFHQALPTGLLVPPSQAGLSLIRQLEAPQLGEPNLVVVGPPSAVARSRAFSPLTDPGVVRAALRSDGFSEIGRLILPDGRVMQLWWKERGPAIPTVPTKPSPPSAPSSPAGAGQPLRSFTGA